MFSTAVRKIRENGTYSITYQYINHSPFSKYGFFKKGVLLTHEEKEANECAKGHPMIYENGIVKHNLTNSESPRAGPYENHKIEDKNIVMWPKGYEVNETKIDKRGELSKEIDVKILEKEKEIAERYTKRQNNNNNDE
jgi:hypothetical protein